MHNPISTPTLPHLLLPDYQLPNVVKVEPLEDPAEPTDNFIIENPTHDSSYLLSSSSSKSKAKAKSKKSRPRSHKKRKHNDASEDTDSDDSEPSIQTKLESFVSSQALAPPTEVPLRATQAPKKMKGMMGVFRINPFAMHSGVTTYAGDDDTGGGSAKAVMPGMCWEPGPLEEEPVMLEFQLELIGYEVDSDDDDDPEHLSQQTTTKRKRDPLLDSEKVLLELSTLDDNNPFATGQLQHGYLDRHPSSTVSSSLRLHTFSPDFDVHDDFTTLHVTRYASTPISACHTEDHHQLSLGALCASCSDHDDGSGTITALLPAVPPSLSSESPPSSSSSSSSSLVMTGNEGDLVEYVPEFPPSAVHQHMYISSRDHWTTMEVTQRHTSPQQHDETESGEYEYDASARGKFQQEQVQAQAQQTGITIQTEIDYATTTRGHLGSSQSQDQQQPCSFTQGTGTTTTILVAPMGQAQPSITAVSQDQHQHHHHHHEHSHQHQHHHHHPSPIPIPIQSHLAQPHIRTSGIGMNGLGLYTPTPMTSTNVSSHTNFDVPRPTSTASSITSSTVTIPPSSCVTSPPLPTLPPPLPPPPLGIGTTGPSPLGCVATTPIHTPPVPSLASLSSESSESTCEEPIGVSGVVDESHCSMVIPVGRRTEFTSVGSTHLHLGGSMSESGYGYAGYSGYGQPSLSYHRSQQHQQRAMYHDHHYHPYLRPTSSHAHQSNNTVSQHYVNSRSYRGREYHQCGSASPSMSGGYYSTTLGSGEYSDTDGVSRQTGSELLSSSSSSSSAISSSVSSHAYTCTTY